MIRRILNSPEWNVAVFAFLLNFFWEVQQMPFFILPSDPTCWQRTRNCTLATIGDIGIALIAFWTVAVVWKSRYWFFRPRWQQIGSLIAVSVTITILFEALATEVFNLWKYADSMPRLPILGLGLLPLLQWILLPPIVIWFVKRQLVKVSFRRSKSV